MAEQTYLEAMIKHYGTLGEDAERYAAGAAVEYKELQERIAELEAVLQWAYMVGGGDVYQEEFGRVCFCSGCRITDDGSKDSKKHTTGCDELNQRIQKARKS